MYSVFILIYFYYEVNLESLFLSIDISKRHLISSIYSSFNVDLTPSNAAKRKWELELGSELDDDYWDVVLKAIHSSSICSRHSLIQAKVVFKIHYTRLKLSRIYPGLSDACLRCGLTPADHLHTFITCPRLHPFWCGIFETVNLTYNKDYEFDTLIALFGVSPRPLKPRFKNKVFAFITRIARKIILLNSYFLLFF